ncbi:MAG: hypothetical protein P1U63_06825 [Coxiellaceae bacterium]|nr:hypothetical protein [Coxiellaceae bacterium]
MPAGRSQMDPYIGDTYTTNERVAEIDHTILEASLYPNNKRIKLKLVASTGNTSTTSFESADALYQAAASQPKSTQEFIVECDHQNARQTLLLVTQLLIKQSLQTLFIKNELPQNDYEVDKLVKFQLKRAKEALSAAGIKIFDRKIFNELQQHTDLLKANYQAYSSSLKQDLTGEYAFEQAMRSDDVEMLSLLANGKKYSISSALVERSINKELTGTTRTIQALIKHAKPTLSQTQAYYTQAKNNKTKKASSLLKYAPSAIFIRKLKRKLSTYQTDRVAKQITARMDDSRGKAVEALNTRLTDFDPLTCSYADVEALKTAINAVKATGNSTPTFFRSGNRLYFDVVVKPLQKFVDNALQELQKTEQSVDSSTSYAQMVQHAAESIHYKTPAQ